MVRDHKPQAIAGESRFCRAADGLRLHYRRFAARGVAEECSDRSPRVAVACLPGLTRTAEDFDVLARALAQAGHEVIAIDYRGRGLSENARDAAEYAVPVEAGDVLAAMDDAGISRFAVVGTSRGGLIALLLGSTAPQRLAGIVFNDIGPAIEHDGLLAIKGYVGRTAVPADHAQGAMALRRLFGTAFTALTDEDWLAWARRAWREKDGALEQTYDARIAATLAAVDAATPPPPLWQLYDALPAMPLMVIRGENSNLLSVETVAEMARRRPSLVQHAVPGQGHAPLLADADSIAAIRGFLAGC